MIQRFKGFQLLGGFVRFLKHHIGLNRVQKAYFLTAGGLPRQSGEVGKKEHHITEIGIENRLGIQM
jgi:hypothetical protein